MSATTVPATSTELVTVALGARIDASQKPPPSATFVAFPKLKITFGNSVASLKSAADDFKSPLTLTMPTSFDARPVKLRLLLPAPQR